MVPLANIIVLFPHFCSFDKPLPFYNLTALVYIPTNIYEMSFPFPYPLWYLLSFDFLVIDMLFEVSLIIKIVLMCISLMDNDAEHIY